VTVARRLLAVAVCALVVAPAAAAATTSGPVFTAPVVKAGHPTLTKAAALKITVADPKVAAWLARYPEQGRTEQETFNNTNRTWTVQIWWGSAGEIVETSIDDASGAVLFAYTGPQVAWGMARGVKGAFGGDDINSPWVWGAFCLVFVLGLADFRKLFSLRNLDLLMLLSPTASLWFFNHGHIFAAVPLFYPALIWVVLRGAFVGVTGRGTRSTVLWPVWVLLAATVFLAGFRVGLNVESSNVIDVGYSGVIGAERIIAGGQAPWGNFPNEGRLPPCGPADSSGEIRDRIQTNHRCEAANPEGDTYGPVAYEAYIPGYLALGWSGQWDTLPAAHFTSIAFDLLAIIGLWLVGLRFGGLRLASILGFAWAAYPFTQYVSNSNTNDSIMPCLLIYGFWLASSPVGRGVFGALSGWTKFASLVVAPLWATYPDRRPSWKFLLAFAAATAAAFSIVFLEPSGWHELRVFWDRTIGFQKGRSSPFSLWDWRQYHARGLPDLHILQKVLEGALLVAAVAVAFVPRHKSPLQLAALTAALLAGFELVLTYWLYTYIPWFFPFAAIAVLAPAVAARVPARAEEPDVHPWPLIPSAG